MKAIVGSQAYPWFQHYREQGKRLEDVLDEVLAQVADAGLEAWEPSLTTEADGRELPRLLEKHKLKLASFYTNAPLHTPEWKRAADQVVALGRWAKPLGAGWATVNPEPIDWRKPLTKTDEQLRRQAEAMGYLARALRDVGLVLSYHTHDSEMRAAAREFHRTVLAGWGSGVKLCLDAHWVFRGAENSQVALEDIVHLYGDRIAVMHLRQSHNGVWTEHLAAGDVDYTPIVRRLQSIHFDGPLYLETAIEKGTPRTMSMVEAHRRSRAWVKDVFGV